MRLCFRKLSPSAKTPTRGYRTDAGLDLYADSIKLVNGTYRYGTGIAVRVPDGYVGLCFMRSSVREMDLMLANAVGVIDAGYIGEIVFSYRATMQESPRIYSRGDKVGQLVIVPIPEIELIEFDMLDETERGTNGHGSTWK